MQILYPRVFFFAEHRVDEEPWQSEIGFRSDAKTKFQLSPTFRLRGDFVKPKKYHAGAIVAFSGLYWERRAARDQVNRQFTR
jgi:hypothetical protein